MDLIQCDMTNPNERGSGNISFRMLTREPSMTIEKCTRNARQIVCCSCVCVCVLDAGPRSLR